MASSNAGVRSTISYQRYAPIFECYITYYERYERLFSIGAYAVKLLALITQAIATIVHIQPDDSVLFGSQQNSQRIGYIFGFIAVFLAGWSSLLPLEQSASRYRYAAALMGKYLTTREPLPRSDIHKIYDIDSIILPQASSFRACREALLEDSPSDDEDDTSVTTPTPALNAAPAAQKVPKRKKKRKAPKKKGVTIEFAEYAPLLICANHGFRQYSVRFFRAYYTLATIQLVFTASTAVFHGDLSVLLDVSETELSYIGIISGLIGTISSAAISVLPLKDMGERCLRAHSTINEYIISEDALPSTVLEQLYTTPTLCFKNPLLSERCLKILDDESV